VSGLNVVSICSSVGGTLVSAATTAVTATRIHESQLKIFISSRGNNVRASQRHVHLVPSKNNSHGLNDYTVDATLLTLFPSTTQTNQSPTFAADNNGEQLSMFIADSHSDQYFSHLAFPKDIPYKTNSC
jgi:hypothetical protein